MGNYCRFELMKEIKIPIEVFELKRLSPTENIVYYLTYNKNLKQNEIAFILKRDPRTIYELLIRAEHKIQAIRKTEPKAWTYYKSRLGYKDLEEALCIRK